jgi:AMMECR1 domain-containing protein
MEVTPKITKKHLAYCFSTIINSIKKKTQTPLAFPSNIEDFNLPLFVTWKITSTDDLRGCIGMLLTENNEKAHSQKINYQRI